MFSGFKAMILLVS